MTAFSATLEKAPPIYVKYSDTLEAEINQLSNLIAADPDLGARYNPRWLAIQLLEKDLLLLTEVSGMPHGNHIIAALEESRRRLRTQYGNDIDIALADHRYSYANALVRSVVTRPLDDGLTFSDKVDRIVTHRWLGIPIFLVLMWAVFNFTTHVSAPYLDWIDGVFAGPISNWVVALLTAVGLGGSWVENMLIDGVIAGVGGLLVFIPVLMSLYFALALMEDSGYMARAAFVMDKAMHRLGLHGKSFIPMVVGFGCTVPAIYATRTLEHKSDRILTGLLVPFMSCSARLPVYVLFAAIFFPKYAGFAIFSMYLIGILIAMVLGIIFKNTIFKGKDTLPFVMELPPYRRPNLKNVWIYMWQRTAGFVQGAATIILFTSMVVWLLTAIPVQGDGEFAATDIDQSAFASLSGILAPTLAPLGFGTWEATGALLTGFVAKEVVISTMGQIYGLEGAEEAGQPTTLLEDLGFIVVSFWEATIDTLKALPLIIGINLFPEEADAEPTGLMQAIQASFVQSSGGYAPLAGLAFMLFVLIYTPCMAAIAAARHELGTGWMWVSVWGQAALAWVVAFAVFQVGKLLMGVL